MATLIKKACLILPIMALTIGTTQANNVEPSDNAYFITEQLMIPTGSNQTWQWESFEKLPNPQNYELQKAPHKYSTNEGDYTLSRDIIGNKAIKVSGPETAPRIVMFTGYDKNNAWWELADIVNTAHVTELKSNCTLKDISTHYRPKNITISTGQTLEYQKFYKWQRQGSQPLYIAESKGEGYIASSTYAPYSWQDYMLVRDPKVFNEYHVWNTTENGEQITCEFD